VSFGLNGSTITASVTVASSQASINVSAGTTSNNVSALTFANSNGLSFGLNGSVLTGSFGNTISVFSQGFEFITNFSFSQATLSLQKISLPMNLIATQMAMLLDFEGNSASSGALTINHAVYTFNASTASLASSGSRTASWTSGTATSASTQYGGASGTRYRTIGVSYSMTPGDYLFGCFMSTANNVTINIFGRGGISIVGGIFDGIGTAMFLDGTSISSIAAFPVSIAVTNTNYARSGAAALRQPGVILMGTGL
jgi:hypothetical protein